MLATPCHQAHQIKFLCMLVLHTKNSIRDANTPQPGEIALDTMRY